MVDEVLKFEKQCIDLKGEIDGLKITLNKELTKE